MNERMKDWVDDGRVCERVRCLRVCNDVYDKRLNDVFPSSAMHFILLNVIRSHLQPLPPPLFGISALGSNLKVVDIQAGMSHFAAIVESPKRVLDHRRKQVSWMTTVALNTRLSSKITYLNFCLSSFWRIGEFDTCHSDEKPRTLRSFSHSNIVQCTHSGNSSIPRTVHVGREPSRLFGAWQRR